MVAIAAILSGTNGWNEIEGYAHSKHDWFLSFLTLPTSCWALGYPVSAAGRHEAVIRAYIRNQEKEDERLDQINSLM